MIARRTQGAAAPNKAQEKEDVGFEDMECDPVANF
jgi:hypothetical protein